MPTASFQCICTQPGCALAVPPGLGVAKMSWKGGDISVMGSGPEVGLGSLYPCPAETCSRAPLPQGPSWTSP